MNRKALLIAVVSAVIGLLLLLLYQRRFENEAAGGRQVPVLYAAQDFAPGEPISEAKLGIRSIPEAYLEDRHIRRSELRRVIGIHVSAPVRANQALLWSDLATGSDVRRDLSSLVRPNMRAVTIRADLSSTFGGLLRPGDRVDVLTSMARTEGEGDRVTLPLLQNVLVLASGRDTGGEAQAARGNRGTSTGSSSTESNQVTLSTTIQEAALLVFAQDRGRLSLILRNPEDIAIIEGLPETGINDVLQARGRAHAAVAPAAPAQPQPHGIEAIRGGGGGGGL